MIITITQLQTFNTSLTVFSLDQLRLRFSRSVKQVIMNGLNGVKAYIDVTLVWLKEQPCKKYWMKTEEIKYPGQNLPKSLKSNQTKIIKNKEHIIFWITWKSYFRKIYSQASAGRLDVAQWEWNINMLTVTPFLKYNGIKIPAKIVSGCIWEWSRSSQPTGRNSCEPWIKQHNGQHKLSRKKEAWTSFSVFSILNLIKNHLLHF